ncbi:acyl-CoA thioesterase domain-containing protein [Nocardioides sp.]|uniref:acyl-CoA thioesterase domain-containing protein n=1 Tax=Nocardioides sp. TaxID=35761 RepID=UPI002728F32B|nr:acyl-CoA thioesterase domain-containing protein [Nocardioides sp.]MDO9456424.1 thioesterase family protein [Nocardioides sp.]
MDLSTVSFFTLDPDQADDGEVLLPTPLACSSWSSDQVHGVAISGAFARAAEQALAALGRDDLRPARQSVDLFRPARMAPFHLSTEVVREGPRICLVDVTLRQEDEPVARASVLFLRTGEPASGTVWSPQEEHASHRPPSEDVAPPTDQPRVPFVHSDAGWTQRFGDHQNASRKSSWNSAVPVVAGETLTPFQAVAATADGTSLVTNWGTEGVQHINTDITLSLARLPRGVEVGLTAIDRVEHDGIAVGTAAVFDREGPIGEVVLTSIVNARRAIDFNRVEYDDDGTRHDS